MTSNGIPPQPVPSKRSNALFDIEDLSQMLEERPKGGSLDNVEEEKSPRRESAPRQDNMACIDTLPAEERLEGRPKQGCNLRYRIGVLGVGRGVEQFFRKVSDQLRATADPLAKELNLWARYQVGLFGGKPTGQLDLGDAEVLVDRLDLFRPNYLALVNAGNVKNKFADQSAHHLALLTRHVNSGALRSQKPYCLVVVTDTLVAEGKFREYQQACAKLATRAARQQFRLDEVERMTTDIRTGLARYVRDQVEALT